MPESPSSRDSQGEFEPKTRERVGCVRGCFMLPFSFLRPTRLLVLSLLMTPGDVHVSNTLQDPRLNAAVRTVDEVNTARPLQVEKVDNPMAQMLARQWFSNQERFQQKWSDSQVMDLVGHQPMGAVLNSYRSTAGQEGVVDEQVQEDMPLVVVIWQGVSDDPPTQYIVLADGRIYRR